MTSLVHIPLLPTGEEPAPHLPWVRWAMKGSYFKLLSADPAADRFTLLIRVEAGVEAPRHRHVGTVEGFVLSGDFFYLEHPEEKFGAGSYLYEPAGSVHQPMSTGGALMIGMFHGAVEGVDGEGNITGRVDCAWHVRTWQEAVAAMHR